jgi:hypothetical protein
MVIQRLAWSSLSGESQELPVSTPPTPRVGVLWTELILNVRIAWGARLQSLHSK